MRLFPLPVTMCASELSLCVGPKTLLLHVVSTVPAAADSILVDFGLQGRHVPNVQLGGPPDRCCCTHLPLPLLEKLTLQHMKILRECPCRAGCISNSITYLHLQIFLRRARLACASTPSLIVPPANIPPKMQILNGSVLSPFALVYRFLLLSLTSSSRSLVFLSGMVFPLR